MCNRQFKHLFIPLKVKFENIIFHKYLPHYRLAIWKKLLESKYFSMEIYYSGSKFQEIESKELRIK